VIRNFRPFPVQLTCAPSRLGRERKQGMVAPSGPGRAIGCAEQRIEFRFDQESDEPSVETLAWDGKHALDYGGMLGMSKRGVSEQRTDGGKSSVAGARTIFPLLLKMVEEGADERRIKIVDV
jgi:hypothetical protein